MTALLVPPVAFLIYIALSVLLNAMAKSMAPATPTSAKSVLYASGEVPSGTLASPGYRPFFVVALFFAVLHLGVLVLATGELNETAMLFIGGLIVTLAALILG